MDTINNLKGEVLLNIDERKNIYNLFNSMREEEVKHPFKNYTLYNDYLNDILSLINLNNEYRENVIAFETPFKFFADAPDSTLCGDELIWTEDFGLFCFDVAHGEGRVIDNLEEISSEEWLKALDDCVAKIRCY